MNDVEADVCGVYSREGAPDISKELNMINYLRSAVVIAYRKDF